MRKIIGGLFTRAFFITASVLLQVIFWIVVVQLLGDYSQWFFAGLLVLSIFSAIYVIVQDTYPETKIPWILFMFAFPLVGGIVYFMYSGQKLSKRKREIHEEIEANLKQAMSEIKDRHIEFLEHDPHAVRQSEYIDRIASSPAHMNTQVTYYKLGEEKLEGMIEALKEAKKFIFMEYFIIEEGKMWDSIESVLIEKAAEGVDVRIMYDDLGCALTLPPDFAKRLATHRIDARVFNKFTHLFNANFNNRDHRKICVIDGNVGFTGGINLADEYINHKVKHGHWKDTAVKLEGDAVYNLTIMFLSMWSSVTEKIENFSDYAPTKQYPSDGVIQPFSDTPLDNDSVGETVYMNILNRATDYVYITTPYLIISHDLLTSLKTAAKSGVDVRIILPGIGDKKFVHFTSRSYYPELIKAGVKIYEYTPGFIHSKMFISDDLSAVVGTINLDYRSLNLHYECGVWMYESSVVHTIKDDFLTTLSACREITVEDVSNHGKFRILKFTFLGILRAISPLM